MNEILEYINCNCDDEEVIRFPDLDDALIGFSNPWDTSGIQPTRLIYSYSKCVEILSQSMSHEEAVEWMSYNTEGGYLGPHTPIVMHEC
jgi:hypothetical protein